MKRLVIIASLAAALALPVAFAAAPTLPPDIGTWESYVRICIPKPDTPLRITEYRKQTEGSITDIGVIKKEGQDIAQFEIKGPDPLTFTLSIINKGVWVTHNFTSDQSSMDTMDQELETTIGMPLVGYLTCGK